MGALVATALSVSSLLSETMRQVEQIGLDMRDRAEAVLSPAEPWPGPYVFLDASLSGCATSLRHWVGDAIVGPLTCPPPTRYPDAYLADILAALAALAPGNRPAAVIFDLPGTPAELIADDLFAPCFAGSRPDAAESHRQRIREALWAMPFPIVLDASARRGEHPLHFVVPDWSEAAVAKGAPPNVYRAGFHLFIDPQLRDGVIRRAPGVVAADVVRGDGAVCGALQAATPPGWPTLLPDAALVAARFAAAAKASDPVAAAGRVREHLADLTGGVSVPRAEPAEPAEPVGAACADRPEAPACLRSRFLDALDAERTAPGGPKALGRPISFALPSAALDPERARRSILHVDLATRTAAGGGFDLQWLDLRDRVVIVGVADIEGGDWRLTPLGQMTGAEVLLNAVWTHTAAGPLVAPAPKAASPWAPIWKLLLKMLAKIPYLLAAAAVFAMGVSLGEGLVRRLLPMSDGTRRADCLRLVGNAVVVPTAMAAAALAIVLGDEPINWAIDWALGGLFDTPLPRVDIFVPLLAIAAEKFVVDFHKLVDGKDD